MRGVAGNRIGVVLAGTGAIAPKHARAIARTDGLSLVAVLSRDRARAESLASRFGADATTDAAEALARDDVGALAICTEHDRHLPLLRLAAEAGRHVVIEKPLAVDVDAGARALGACAAAGVVVACVFQRRFDPALVRLKRAVEEGRTGRAIGLELSMVWRRDARYFTRTGSAWRGDPARAGGGVAMMQAIHLLDAARWLFGEVVEVEGSVANARGRAAVEDVLAATLRFESGALGAVFATTAGAGALAPRAAFHFEHGSAVVEAEHLRAWSLPPAPGSASDALRRSARFRERIARRLPWRLVPRHAGPKGRFEDVYLDFAEAVGTGRSPRSEGGDALRSVAVVQALYEAASEGRRVAVRNPLRDS
ncbi:MAG: Gfo/Idh/MocA family protein [Planctomycetota bacterium JB042]